MAILEGLKIFFGGAFILFLPGFLWTFVFFASKEIYWVERIALSFALSIAIVPLSIFWLNRIFGVKITLLSTSLVIIALMLIATAYLVVTKKATQKDEQCH